MIPPDTNGAVGPDHLMVPLNSQVRIQDKTGNAISTVSLRSFWASLGVRDVFDPKVIYDPDSERFLFVTCAERKSAASSMLFGVSATSNPTGRWHLWKLDGDGADTKWVDYPNIGVNGKWITFTANMYAIGYEEQLVGVNIWVVDKSTALDGNDITVTLFYVTDVGGTHVPCLTYSGDEPTQYLVNAWNSSSGLLRLYTITGSPSSPIWAATELYPVSSPWQNPWLGLPDAPQQESSLGIATNDSRIMNAVLRNGRLWCTHTVGLPEWGEVDRTAAKWWEIDPITGTAIQSGVVEDTAGCFFYYFPSIAVNKHNEVLLGFTGSSLSAYAGAYYTYRNPSTPIGTMHEVSLLKEGEAPYYKTFSRNRNRWGDFSATCVDPVDDVSMWTIQEYAESPANTWGTWWGLLGGDCTDKDGDGYGDPARPVCPHPEFDCDDSNPAANPGNLEGPAGDSTCGDLVDNDCDGDVDVDDPGCIPCTDLDGDGYGNPASPHCTYPDGDCDDSRLAVHPGTAEVCDNVDDDDCDGLADGQDPDCFECMPDFSVTAPFSEMWGFTCWEGNDCVLFPSEEHVYEVAIPWSGTWTFDLCNSDYDTRILVGTTPNNNDIGEDDDGCGFQSRLTATLAAETYFVTVEGFAESDCGGYFLDIYSNVCGIGNGDCCRSNGTPGCEIANCCETVCARDTLCCEMTWDADCTSLAENLCEEVCAECNPDYSVTAPFWDTGYARGAGNDCDASPGEEYVYEVEIPWSGTWTFDLCNSSYPTHLLVGALKPGKGDIGEDTGSCYPQSRLTVDIPEGTYYVTIEGPDYDLECAHYVLIVSPPCVDLDQDGYGSPVTLVCRHTEEDCDDTNPDVNPGALEIALNGIDENCDGWDCFIATAAFGSSLQGKIEVLRAFRDVYLLTNEAGLSFLSIYYSYSPPIADYIAERAWLRAVTRILLLPLIGIASLFV